MTTIHDNHITGSHSLQNDASVKQDEVDTECLFLFSLTFSKSFSGDRKRVIFLFL